MGESFSIDNGYSRPTPATSAIKQRVPGGTVKPAIFAITSTDLPTIAELSERCGVATTFPSCSASAAERKCAPWSLNCSRTACSIGASQTTACSEAQIVPLSKHLPVKMSCTAFGTSAVRSTHTGTLPGPTPNAGLPDEYAARTSPIPPVARITAVCLCFIKVSVPSIVAVVMQPIASAGSPSLTPASRMTRAVSLIHFAADGCGDSTTVLRDLIEIRILKMAVEVGLVDGTMPATTPRGLAISTTSFDSATTPLVRKPRK